MTTAKSLLAWNCKKCTFRHMVPGKRCSMCGSLQEPTREEMADFVRGKRLRPQEFGNVVENVLLSSPLEADQDSGNEHSGDVGSASIIASLADCATSTKCTSITSLAPTRPALGDISKDNYSIRSSGTPVATAKGKNPYSKPSYSTIMARCIGEKTCSNENATVDRTDRGNNPVPPPLPPPSPHPQPQDGDGDTSMMTTNRLLSQQENGPSSATLKLSSDLPVNATAGTPQQQLPRPSPKKSLHPFFYEKASTKRRLLVSLDRQNFEPGPVPLDEETSTTYIYPHHDQYPTRQYQLEITETALNYNTLVSLPTGLGKTHIAAVVMYNFYRWFAPHGKIIFLAPTLPLVNQQVDACYKIMGIPAKDTAIMTGKTDPEIRRAWWNEKRVFYCTPQTVQKDLQSSMDAANETGESSLSRFASQVVCLVLDEAHKASGEYAYTKVVELLNHAGAKFRVVGLSATPGTSIKAIQGVIDALQIVKIAARTEEDKSVSPYLHQKNSEIVICERSTQQRDIERRLSDMLGPLLEVLRTQGGLAYSGNATLTSFSILSARKKYVETMRHAAQGNVIGIFNAAQTLVGLRSECHQSLVVVKTKMLRLKNNPQRGILSTIVKSPEFQEIWNKVDEATAGGIGDDGNAATSPAKDPKLSKLCDLLQHHFLFAEQKGESSRAIVFAQFRDSVGEIVEALQHLKPSIRARYFVGQGKGSASTRTKKGAARTTGDDRVVGMKQAEQQKAIRQFKENIFNVLVCTSIGEEGLDIGDVDLIVNYDVLRSPIRTIQRAGRTGRKRDGRVICLISVGQEQQTYDKRLQAERTLMNALKDPEKFKVHKHRPMLPAPPQKQFQTMNIQSQLHMSQVAGARITPGTGKQTSSGNDNSSAWRLDIRQEEEMELLCGDLERLDDGVSWDVLKKYFLKCRIDPTNQSNQENDQKERKRNRKRTLSGRNATILQELCNHGSTHVGGSTRRGYEKIKRVFPTAQVRADKVFRSPRHAPMMSQVKKSLWRDNRPTETTNCIRQENFTEDKDEKTSMGRSSVEHVILEFPPPEERHRANGISQENIHVSHAVGYQSKMTDKLCRTGPPEQNVLSTVVTKQLEAPSPPRLELPPSACANSGFSNPCSSNSFRLPTPPSSSSSSDDESEDDSVAASIPQPIAFQNRSVSNPDVRNRTFSSFIYGEEKHKSTICERGLLPSTETLDSRIEKESYELRGEANVAITVSTLGGKDSILPSNGLQPDHATAASTNDSTAPKCTEIAPKDHIDSGPESLSKCSRNVAHCALTEVDHLILDPPYNCNGGHLTEDSHTLKRRKIQSLESNCEHDQKFSGSTVSISSDQLGRNTAFTPAKKANLDPQVLVDTPVEPFKKANVIGSNNCLTDTPLGDKPVVEIVCEVCKNDDSEHGDRIVLCDSCNTGFHQSCYSILDEVLKRDTPWFCDICMHRSNGSPVAADETTCVYCSKSGGALRNTSLGWCHCFCKIFSANFCSSTCSFCSQQPSVKCKECQDAIHPICALSSGWTVVVPTPSSSAEPSLYCPNHLNGWKEIEGLRVITQGKKKAAIVGQQRPKKLVKKARAFNVPSSELDKNKEMSKKEDNLRRRRAVLGWYALEEADIASDLDVEGDSIEEEEVRRIEEEEGLSQDSFINDNAELTQHFSQDPLGVIDPDADDGGGFDYSHRALDSSRNAQNQFSTPYFNRRMRQPNATPNSSSQGGLGQMHFIRSVLEHHRQGGNAEEIELFYQQVQNEDCSDSPGAAANAWEDTPRTREST